MSAQNPPPSHFVLGGGSAEFSQKTRAEKSYYFSRIGLVLILQALLSYFSLLVLLLLAEGVEWGISLVSGIPAEELARPDWVGILFGMLSMGIGSVGSGLYFSRRLGLEPREWFSHEKAFPICQVVVGTMACLFANQLGGLLVFLLDSGLNQLGWTFSLSAVSSEGDWAGSVLLFLYTAAAAPATEEFLCRGVLLRSLQRAGGKVAIVFSALFFALLHGNFSQGIPAFLIGLLLGYFALRGETLFLVILIHQLNNLLALFLSALPGNLSAGWSWAFSIAGAAALGLGIWYEWPVLRQLFREKASPGSVQLLFSAWSVAAALLFFGAQALGSLQRV